MTRRPRRDAARLFSRVVVALPPLAALAFIAWFALRPKAAEAEAEAPLSVRAGQALPELQVADAAGAVRPLAEVVAGGASAVHVMDPACGHCHTQLERSRDVAAALGAAAPRLVVVVVGTIDRVDEVRRDFPGMDVYVDGEEGLVRRYELKTVPVLLLTDDGRTVRAVRRGLQREGDLRALFGGDRPA